LTKRLILLLGLMVASPSLAASEQTQEPASLRATPYDPARKADVDVNDALTRAKAKGHKTIIILGANWCHDSSSLAGRLESPRFKSLLADHFELVYVDVGTPQTGHGRNLAIPQRFGAKKVKGTPTVLILSAQGKLLNKKDAGTWRNAESRSEDAIFDYFKRAGESLD